MMPTMMAGIATPPKNIKRQPSRPKNTPFCWISAPARGSADHRGEGLSQVEEGQDLASVLGRNPEAQEEDGAGGRSRLRPHQG